MKKTARLALYSVVACAGVGVAVFWWWRSLPNETTPEPFAVGVIDPSLQRSTEQNKRARLVGPETLPEAIEAKAAAAWAAPGLSNKWKGKSIVVDPDLPPRALDGVRLMIRDYLNLVGETPVGSNAEIMKAVMGGNSRQAQLGPPIGQRLNSRGELIDPWGTPYFFHQITSVEMEITSAGPDGIMGTGDDLTVR